MLVGNAPRRPAGVTADTQKDTPQMTEKSGGVRGAGDIELAAAIGRAIIAARGEMSQPELSRRTGIDQPTISKLERGTRPSSLTLWEMRAIERACDRPAGFILGEVGYLRRRLSTRQALQADARLSAEARVILLAALEAAHSMSDNGVVSFAPLNMDRE